MITAIVLTHNSESTLDKCLSSLSWCDEILVIDDFSEDATVQMAKKHKSTVLKRALANDFAAQRNFGLKQARFEWVLYIDADEFIPQELQNEISEAISSNSDIKGFYFNRSDLFAGEVLNYGESAYWKEIRLAQKNAGAWKGSVHERWMIEGNIGYLKYPIIHNQQTDLTGFLSKINFYSTLAAREFYEQGKRSSLGQIIFYPTAKFLINYFVKMGIRDGMPGFIQAICMSFHSFLVRSKLYLLQKE